jgi:hypothetical protein
VQQVVGAGIRLTWVGRPCEVESKLFDILGCSISTGCIKKPEFGRFFHVFSSKILKMTHISLRFVFPVSKNP